MPMSAVWAWNFADPGRLLDRARRSAGFALGDEAPEHREKPAESVHRAAEARLGDPPRLGVPTVVRNVPIWIHLHSRHAQ